MRTSETCFEETYRGEVEAYSETQAYTLAIRQVRDKYFNGDPLQFSHVTTVKCVQLTENEPPDGWEPMSETAARIIFSVIIFLMAAFLFFIYSFLPMLGRE